ncbi:HAD-IIA family hydrolase [Denitrobaculum tricleocarpae]|uniref:HAD family hydrolase n=1 Tax=Denitrobaculum tricleocarpae TaxID=2591009 RepID=A0A545TG24_9PROT|nr:HAD family hydrolase [Denitrobaculum tricleocarpae]TQV76131.1 HAD family hydrolase [Denitrobaculum tricleocarpae]
MSTDRAFARYEAVRKSLPKAQFPSNSIEAENLGALAKEFDVFVLDAFGVINVGNTAIPGAPERIAALQAMEKETYVLTNGASFNAAAARAKYTRLGYSFDASRIVASRDVLASHMSDFAPDFKWGFMAFTESKIEELCANPHLLEDDPALYDRVEGFILLSSIGWSRPRQELLVRSLQKNKRPVLVGNPDLVAPLEASLSFEPGFFAHDIADRTGIEPRFFGKPFANAFEEVARRIERDRPGMPGHRIAMVGDTLHTDILGGAAAGFRTVLVTDHGLFKGHEIAPYIAESQIVPDFIVRTT